MKKVILIALCFMALNLKAQTVLINGIARNQNDTIKCGPLAHVEVINVPTYIVSMERVYYGVTFPFSGTGDFMTSVGAKKLRLNFYWNGGRSWFICWIKK